MRSVYTTMRSVYTTMRPVCTMVLSVYMTMLSVYMTMLSVYMTMLSVCTMVLSVCTAMRFFGVRPSWPHHCAALRRRSSQKRPELWKLLQAFLQWADDAVLFFALSRPASGFRTSFVAWGYILRQ